MRHTGFLLTNFRLLEAAGACGRVAAMSSADWSLEKPPEWWEAVADTAPTYRSAIFLVRVRGFAAIDEWSATAAPGSDADLSHERARLLLEHREWLCDVAGGGAYVAWLSAHVAAAELGGAKALSSLDSCAAIVREFVDVPQLGREPSLYEFLQSAADALSLFLPLAAHPVRDMGRFAFVPPPQASSYGS